MFVAKLKVRSREELKLLGRENDGPIQLERREDDPPLVPGREVQVVIMARGRCRCMVQVKNMKHSFTNQRIAQKK